MRRERMALDHRPGSLPDIRATGGNIIFSMAPTGTPSGDRLVIRCGVDGEIWVAIEPSGRPAPGEDDASAHD